MDNYSVTIKYVHRQEAGSIEGAIRNELEELPDNALILEATAFPSRVESKFNKPEHCDRDAPPHY